MVQYPNVYPAVKNTAAFEDSDCITFPTKPLHANDGCIYGHNSGAPRARQARAWTEPNS